MKFFVYAGNGNMGASFCEFDFATFRFPGGRDVPDEREKAAFKQQNLIIRGRNVDTSLSAVAIPAPACADSDFGLDKWKQI